MKKFVEKTFYDAEGNEVQAWEKVDCSFKDKFFPSSPETDRKMQKAFKIVKGVGIVVLGAIATVGIISIATASGEATKEMDELTEDPMKLLDDEPKPEKDVADQIIEKELGLDSVETKVLEEV